jgi:hypothetical protein
VIIVFPAHSDRRRPGVGDEPSSTRSSRRIALPVPSVLTPVSRCLFESRSDPGVGFSSLLNGKFPGLTHDERELFVGRLRVGRHEVALSMTLVQLPSQCEP